MLMTHCGEIELTIQRRLSLCSYPHRPRRHLIHPRRILKHEGLLYSPPFHQLGDAGDEYSVVPGLGFEQLQLLPEG
jgi:hypothetical protein